MTEAQIKKILVDGAYVTIEQMKEAEEYATTHSESVIDYFFSKNIITPDLYGQAIAESMNVSYADLNSNMPSREQVMRIPEDIGQTFRAVLFQEKEGTIVVTTDNPRQKHIVQTLERVFPNSHIIVAYSLSEDIDAALVRYRQALSTRFAKIISEERRVAPEIIDEILEDAFVYQVSDIHFEPQEKDVVIRFRIDGVLHEAGRIPKKYYENMLNRIKVQANLRIDEHFSAQDGAMRYMRDGQNVDLRVSIVPTLDGEKVVIRMLYVYVRGYTLTDLGLSEHDAKILSDAAKKPFGMILVTGPTGSGKSTTLYALIKILNRPNVNITTIEDPVEYKIVGANQIQVNTETELTFARGLRSIVRQDPDIILVGEIRDEETAEIAVNASLTGHLLLSTFHANDAATAIPRLLDMGVEPFLLVSTLEVIIAQRLVRKICDNCITSYPASPEDLAKTLLSANKYFGEEPVTLYRGKGCKACEGIGFKGRMAIFEFIQVTREMEELVLQNPSTQQIWDLARTQGAHSLFEDGVEKVKKGVTTLEELLRVVAPPNM